MHGPESGRLLLGAFGRAEDALAYARRVSTADEDWLQRQWAPARHAFLAAARNGGKPVPGPLDGTLLDEVTDRLNAPLFSASLKGRRWRLAAVPIDALAAPQPMVNLARVGRMASVLENGLAPLLFPTETALDVKAEV